MSSLFYYTGVVVWVIIGFIAICVFFVIFWTLWDRDISPSLANLRFAVFGKPWQQAFCPVCHETANQGGT